MELAKTVYDDYMATVEKDSERIVQAMQRAVQGVTRFNEVAAARRRIDTAYGDAQSARDVASGAKDSATATQDAQKQQALNSVAAIADAALLENKKYEALRAAVVGAETKLREVSENTVGAISEGDYPKAVADAQAALDKANAALVTGSQKLESFKTESAAKVVELLSQVDQQGTAQITQISASVTTNYQEILKAAQDKMTEEGGKVSSSFALGLQNLTALLNDKIPDAQQTAAFEQAFNLLIISQEGRDMKIFDLVQRLTGANNTTLARMAALEGSVANLENAIANTAAQTGIRLNVR